MTMTQTTPSVPARVGGEEGDGATSALKVKLDLALLVIGGLNGRVLEAAEAMRPYAQALADHFGHAIREQGISQELGYPVHLPVDIVEIAANDKQGIPKQLERTACYEWLNENVPLGDDSFRWAVTPNGKPNEVFVKIVKRRGRQASN